MKKLFLLLICLLATAALLSACGCEHIWTDANCDTPKTCSECDETEGAPLGHVWQAATCTDAKVCQVCKKTDGQALGHSWKDADCEKPKVCEACNKTEGKALGHKWKEATTEAPKTCETCLGIEGTPINTDKRFTTAACKELFGTWVCNYTVDAQNEIQFTIPDQDLNYTMIMTFTFNNDGTGKVEARPEKESYMRVLRIVTIEQFYYEFAQEGYSRDEAELAMEQTYGMGVEQYVDTALAQMNLAQLTVSTELVYYVQDGVLYDASSWEETFDTTEFTITGSVLSMTNEINGVDTLLDFEKQP